MKRGGPIQRKTPLKSAGGLKRGGPLERKAPPPSRRSEPRRAALRGAHGMDYPEARRIVFGRSGGRCEVCGDPLETFEAHHRLTRRFGPDCPCNLLALCSRCHHDRVHGEPEDARERGRIISRHAVVLPAEHPVEVHRHGLVLLDCSGNFARTA